MQDKITTATVTMTILKLKTKIRYEQKVGNLEDVCPIHYFSPNWGTLWGIVEDYTDRIAMYRFEKVREKRQPRRESLEDIKEWRISK